MTIRRRNKDASSYDYYTNSVVVKDAKAVVKVDVKKTIACCNRNFLKISKALRYDNVT